MSDRVRIEGTDIDGNPVVEYIEVGGNGWWDRFLEAFRNRWEPKA